MNFTREIKRELIRSVPESRMGKLALFSAAIKTCGKSDPESGEFSFTSESEEVAGYLVDLAEQLFGLPMTVTGAVRDPKHGKNKLTFSGKGDQLLSDFPNDSEEEGAPALKGAFLCGGSCTLPKEGKKTGYHLEIVFDTLRSAEEFCSLLEEEQLLGNIVARGDKQVVYCKSREAIADFLSAIGAENALRTLEYVASAREESNNSNRKINCYAGNADKSAIASAEQVLALQKMQKEGMLASLSEPLKETASARLSNPELSLKELAEKLGISKSCLYHRMKKLMSLCS